ncbi:MAG: sugar-binding protein [Propionibacteriaceae bacterium]|jgi:putative multiple sugar transport system substrate-binding protein|nr:sugar-binding protein [Propionibacteriaceae bacterium]
MKLKKLAAGAIGAVLALGLTACANENANSTATTTGSNPTSGAATTGAPAAAGGLVGISMPTTTLERWNNDGKNLVDKLKGMGYTTDLEYADNKPELQVSQLENMINADAKVLVIAAIDGTVLGPVLQTAADAGIKVIAYDRLINGTKNVDYYATFDNEKVGTLQGQFIETQLGLKDGKGPFNLEPFAGSPDDNNAKFFFKGAWDVLLPYVQSGKLVVPSGKSPASVDEWQNIGIQAWKTETAQAEMQNRLNSYYSGGAKVDVVLSPNDSLALGIEQALQGAGYQVGTDWPVITGQDGDLANVKNMLAGLQSMTVWKDTRELGDQAAKMVDQIMKGTTVDVNNNTYDNGVKVVPAYLLTPKVVTKDTVESLLVGSGFYKKDQLGL